MVKRILLALMIIFIHCACAFSNNIIDNINAGKPQYSQSKTNEKKKSIRTWYILPATTDNMWAYEYTQELNENIYQTVYDTQLSEQNGFMIEFDISRDGKFSSVRVIQHALNREFEQDALKNISAVLSKQYKPFPDGVNTDKITVRTNISIHPDQSMQDMEKLNVAFTPYMKNLKLSLRANWNPQRKGADNLKTVIYFFLTNEGEIKYPVIIQTSGNHEFDNSALKAVILAGKQPPLPKDCTIGRGLDIEFVYEMKIFQDKIKIPVGNSQSKGREALYTKIDETLYLSNKDAILNIDGIKYLNGVSYTQDPMYDRYNMTKGTYRVDCANQTVGVKPFYERSAKFIDFVDVIFNPRIDTSNSLTKMKSIHKNKQLRKIYNYACETTQ